MSDDQPKTAAQVVKKIESILLDRWSLDQEDGWDEFGQDMLDEFDALIIDYGQHCREEGKAHTDG